MGATAISTTIGQVRDFLDEIKPRFWSDDELVSIYRLGANDLWGAILDLHAEHYAVVDESNVILRANAAELSGVPEDCFRVLLVEPRTIGGSATGRQIRFTPKKFNTPAFAAARARTAGDPGAIGEVFYHVTGVGSPITAPRILTAPRLSSDLLLRVMYCQMLEIGNSNPIPGGSDNALKAWTIAYALAKQGTGAPDADWLGIYATEKQLILTRLTPRQEQEPEVVEDFFQL
jgi:hypothetical protein